MDVSLNSEHAVTQGETLLLWSGEFGDTVDDGVVRALKSFSLRQAMDEFLRRHHPQMVMPQEHTICSATFVQWLHSEGLVEIIPVRSFQIQSWGGNNLATPTPESYMAVGDPEPLPYEEFDPDG